MGFFDAWRSAPICPITDEDRDWIDQSLGWLASEFGIHRLRSVPVITPTSEYFPNPYAGSDEDAGEIFSSICRWMGVDASTVELAFFSEDEPPILNPLAMGTIQRSGATGLYFSPKDEGVMVVAIEDRTLDDPVVLVATMAHELSHVHLLGGHRVSAEDEFHEPLTDLLTVFLGLGVFTANSAFRFSQWLDGSTQGWQASKHGYLPEPMIGYAMACFAWLRGESKPDWVQDLAYNVQVYFKKSLRYLNAVNGGGISSLAVS